MTWKWLRKRNLNKETEFFLIGAQKKNVIRTNDMNTWYMRNQESVVENGSYKVPWDFEMKTDPIISARRPNI